ncbi:hypothetical protein [Candidatus Synchoanobacter obligatus]|uniref:Uncharacterized protein n=1 Tax=Candidatus Synchoanobacter obligatus TaxID=2919597 RepID=A0ABT1L4T0_9GAMM|nr:hypothetical protein [Candidatus Synchoanobacter obligatus]MCP8352180.1 hypothetical protein [Candidatus Synchoanobacter obligatus]
MTRTYKADIERLLLRYLAVWAFFSVLACLRSYSLPALALGGSSAYIAHAILLYNPFGAQTLSSLVKSAVLKHLAFFGLLFLSLKVASGTVNEVLVGAGLSQLAYMLCCMLPAETSWL